MFPSREAIMLSGMEVFTLDDGADLSAPAVRDAVLDAVESGHVVLLPKSGFVLTARERELLSDLKNLLQKEPETKNGRPTIILDPADGKIEKLNFAFSGWLPVRAQVKRSARPELEALMLRFGAWTEDLIARLLPRYRSALHRDRVTYRPNQRSSVQPLHVDSAYGYPTQGRGMLRVFCNVDPHERPRVWQIGEPFEAFATRFLPAVRLKSPSWTSSALARLGLVGGSRTDYDETIAELRRLGKRSKQYQETAPRRIIEFPSGASWIAITDLLLHGAISGQHGIDQTFFLPAAAMRDPSRSSLRILERLSGRQLV